VELLFSGYRVSVWDEHKILKMDNSVVCITLQIYLLLLNCTLRNG
jgi:hypothetical protein